MLKSDNYLSSHECYPCRRLLYWLLQINNTDFKQQFWILVHWHVHVPCRLILNCQTKQFFWCICNSERKWDCSTLHLTYSMLRNLQQIISSFIVHELHFVWSKALLTWPRTQGWTVIWQQNNCHRLSGQEQLEKPQFVMSILPKTWPRISGWTVSRTRNTFII